MAVHLYGLPLKSGWMVGKSTKSTCLAVASGIRGTGPCRVVQAADILGSSTASRDRVTHNHHNMWLSTPKHLPHETVVTTPGG